MYIGASFKCDQYCQQDDKQKYDKSHFAHRHTIIDSRTFKQQNDMFIRKSKRAWNGFSIRLQSFFKKLRNQLIFIEKQAFNRLELQQIKSAIKTQNKRLRNISMDIFQARYRNLTCQDIDQFLQLRKKHQESEPINIKRDQDQFAVDLTDQISSFIREISQQLALKSERRNYRKQEDYRNNNRQRQNQRQKNHREKDYNRERDGERDYPRDRQNNRRNYKNQYDRNVKRNQQKPQRNDQRQSRRIPRKQEREQYKKRIRERDEEQYNKKDIKKNVKQQKPKQRQFCPLLKIEQLKENSKAFDIDLKINNFVKNIYGKEMWKAFDETGQIMLVVPTHNAIKEGAKIRMHNCFVKIFNQKFEIYAKQSSKISYQNTKQQAFKFEQNNFVKYAKSQKYNRNSKQQKNLSKIEELNPDFQQLKLIAKVISVEVLKQSEKKCVLGDETGIVNARFDGYDQLLKTEKILYFRGLQVDVDDCGHMFLTGSKVLIELAHDEVKSVKMANNVSAREYQLLE